VLTYCQIFNIGSAGSVKVPKCDSEADSKRNIDTQIKNSCGLLMPLKTSTPGLFSSVSMKLTEHFPSDLRALQAAGAGFLSFLPAV